MSKPRMLGACFVVTTAIAIGACSASGTDPLTSDTSAGGATGTGGSSTGKGGHSGAGASTGKGGGGNVVGGGGSGLFDGGPTDSGGLTDASACAAVSTKGQLTPLDMFIMLDQSGSMKEVPSGSTVSKWKAVTDGLTKFVQDPAAAGIGVGIQFFGLEDSLGNDSCNSADYRSAAVPIAVLPGNAAPFVNELKKHSPTTSTPTAPALQGAILFAIDWQKAHPDHTTVVVFATDGDPTECAPTNPAALDPCDASCVSTIAGFANTGFTWNPSIRTFVIGMAGATTANLDKWAAAGGTKKAFDASDPNTFVTALNAIRGQALSCELQLPKPQDVDGGMIDFSKINVQTKENGTAADLGQVPNAAGCGPTNGGWYYDNPQNPTHIEICPATCDKLKAAGMMAMGMVEIDILLGCATVVAVPQ
jgi:hypothetical protein